MGKVERTGQGEARSESGLTLTNITAYPDGNGRTHHTATDQHGREWRWSYEFPAESDAEKDWDISYRDTDGQVHQYYTTDDGTWAEDHALEDQNLAKDNFNPYPYSPDAQEENLAQDHLPPPSPYDGIEEKNYAEDHLPGLGEEPPAEQSPQAEPPVQPNPPPPDHGLQENYAKDYGFPGLGVEPPPSVSGQPGLGVEDPAAEDPAPPVPDSQHQAEERARAEEDLGSQTPPYPTPEDLGIQQRYGDDFNIPDLVEEAPPVPPVPAPEGQENYAKDYGFPGLVEEPPAEPYPSAEPPVQPIPPEEPPAEQYPDPYPPAVPGGGELPDGNANGIPGEYGDGPDLDANGIPDEIGINPDMLQAGYPNPATSGGDWGGVGAPDPTVVPPSDATTGAEAMPEEEEYGGGPAPDANWVTDETAAVDPYALQQQPAYPDSSTSSTSDDGAWDPYSGSSFEPYAPPEEAPAVPEGEDPDALGSF